MDIVTPKKPKVSAISLTAVPRIEIVLCKPTNITTNAVREMDIATPNTPTVSTIPSTVLTKEYSSNSAMD